LLLSIILKTSLAFSHKLANTNLSGDTDLHMRELEDLLLAKYDIK